MGHEFAGEVAALGAGVDGWRLGEPVVSLPSMACGACAACQADDGIHCGALRGIGLERIRSNGYIFQVEMAYVAQHLGYELAEAPIHFEDRRIGRSKMTVPVKFEAAWRVWEIRRRHRNLRP